jgi:hypothetical protein
MRQPVIFLRRAPEAKCWLATFFAVPSMTLVEGQPMPLPFTLDATAAQVIADLAARFPNARICRER